MEEELEESVGRPSNGSQRGFVTANRRATNDSYNERQSEAASPIPTGVGIPESSEPAKPREVSIKALNYGYVVTVGCHNFAVETHQKLIEKLGQYYSNPRETEKLWFETQTL